MPVNAELMKTWRDRLLALILSEAASALATLLLIALLAFLSLKGRLPENVQGIALIAVAVVSCLLGGFLCSRKNGRRGFLWGLLCGLLYYGLLCLLPAALGTPVSRTAGDVATALLYCAGSGMLGGMFGAGAAGRR